MKPINDFNFKRWMESDAYAQQKAVINKEVNELKDKMGFALPRLAAPRSLEDIDYTVFKKTTEEKWKLYGLKKQNKDDRNREFGFGNKKLNTTERQLIEKIVLTF